MISTVSTYSAESTKQHYFRNKHVKTEPSAYMLQPVVSEQYMIYQLTAAAAAIATTTYVDVLSDFQLRLSGTRAT